MEDQALNKFSVKSYKWIHMPVLKTSPRQSQSWRECTDRIK